MSQCDRCVWKEVKDALPFCDMIRAAGTPCDRFLSLNGKNKRLKKFDDGDGTFDCPQCGRNRDPGKCWHCELED